MFEIKLDKQPVKFFSKCENEVFDRIVAKLEILKMNPILHDSKRAVGYKLPTFRIRVGKYRVLYRVNYEENRIVVVKIGKRGNVYDD
jgi:mRNA interferase RelE/StbE